jgi:hypothetical protein
MDIPQTQDNLASQYTEKKQSDEFQDNRTWLKNLVANPPQEQVSPLAGQALQVVKPPVVSPEPVKYSPETQPKPATPQPSLVKRLFWDLPVGTGETALSLGTGMVGWAAGKAGGLMTLPFWGGEEAQKFEEYVNQLYTYKPTISESGKGAIEKAGKGIETAFHYINMPARGWGEIAGLITGSPEMKYGVTNIGEVATMLLLPKVAAKVKEVTGITPKAGKPITAEELASWDKEISTSQGIPIEEVQKMPVETKAQMLNKARGDLTAEMEKVNMRAHDEIQGALEAIPKSEWDKVYQEGKPVNISDVETLVRNASERLKAKEVSPDLQKLPQHYQDVIAKEADQLKARADNLVEIAKEADKAGAELIVIPSVLKPRAEPTQATGITKPPEGAIPQPTQIPEGYGKIGVESSVFPTTFAKEGSVTLRPLGDIARDLKKVIDFDERGSISGEPLSADKLDAYNRLKGDFNVIARNAGRVGKTIEQYLTDLGVDPEVVKFVGQKINETAQEKSGGTEPPIPTGTAPDIRVNLDRISNTESVKNIISDINLKQQEAGRIAETTRGTRTHEKTIKASQTEKWGMSVEDVLKRRPGETWNAEQMTSVRDLRDAAGVKVKELTDKSLAGDQQAINDLPATLALFGEIESQRTGASAEIGRALESHKILSEAGREPFDPSNLAELAQAVKDSAGDPALLARRIKALEKPEQVQTFARQLVNGLKKGQNIFTFAWINGLLSGPPTHIVNFSTNAAVFLAGIETRRIAGRIGQVREFFGGDPGVQPGEAGQMVYGAIEGFMDSLDVAKTSWIENETAWGGKGKGTKIENYQKNPLSREALGLAGSYDYSVEFLANTLEKSGEIIGGPGRAMVTSDEFFKGLNYRAEMRARAFREATLEGLSGDKFGERVKYIQDHPDEFPSIDESARKFAEYQTFTNELGTFGKAVQNLTNSTIFTKLIVPFLRTPMDILKYTQDYTPLLNMTSRRFWTDISEGGVSADIALAKMSMGIMFTAATAYLVKSGMITGNGPYDPKLRKMWLEDHQPNSIKIGDTHVAFDRMDFPGNVLGIVADTITLADYMDLDSADQYLAAVALSTADIMVNKTYAKGMSDVLNAMRQPEKGSADYVKQWSRSLVPNIVRKTNQTFFDDAKREVNSISDALIAATPGLSEYLPPTRDFWGRPIFPDVLGGVPLFSPYSTKVDKHNPVTDEILANRIPISFPSKVIGGYKPSESVLQENQPRETWGIKLDPDQYDRYFVISRTLELGGKNLFDRLDELIKSSTYQNQSTGPDGGRSLLIRSYINQYEEVAKQKLLKEDQELELKVKKQQIGRAEALRPTP